MSYKPRLFRVGVIDPIRYAETRQKENLPYVIKFHSSAIVRKLEGVDATLQINKRTNLKLASSTITGLIIHPGETFSFWHQIGKPAADKGYLEGLIITSSKVSSAVGGGLCQLANLLH